jgi:hypothetical protein
VSSVEVQSNIRDQERDLPALFIEAAKVDPKVIILEHSATLEADHPESFFRVSAARLL